MAKYMLLLGGVDPSKRPANMTPEQVTQKYVEWTQRLRAEGRYVSGHKLFDRQGKRLAKQDGRVVDGPFVETKETVGGFYIIEAETLEDATRIAKDCPTVAISGGYVEVRQVEM